MNALDRTPYFFRTIFSFLIIALLAVACKSKSNMGKNINQNADELQAQVDSSAMAQEEKEEVVAAVRDTLIIALARTACFGQCPVFKIRVYESGYATYEGINFVDRMGKFYANISEADRNTIMERSQEVGFYDFENVYDKQGLMDLPSARLTIAQGEERKTVIARWETPKNVGNFFTEVEGILEKQQWKPQIQE